MLLYLKQLSNQQAKLRRLPGSKNADLRVAFRHGQGQLFLQHNEESHRRYGIKLHSPKKKLR